MCTTVIASVWTLAALSRLSGVVTDTVRDSEAVTAVTSKLSGALEREDDAVLLVLAGDQRGTSVLARERTVVDRAVADLVRVLGPADEQELATPLESELQAYRRAADTVAAVAPEREALVQYHQRANPLLRRAVALTTVIRDRHFELARRAVDRCQGRGQRVAARGPADYACCARLCGARGMAPDAAASSAPCGVSREAPTRSEKDASRSRSSSHSRDELGELASAFNQMADGPRGISSHEHR